MLPRAATFRLKDKLGHEYISQDKKNKWDDWRNQWCYIIIDLHK